MALDYSPVYRGARELGGSFGGGSMKDAMIAVLNQKKAEEIQQRMDSIKSGPGQFLQGFTGLKPGQLTEMDQMMAQGGWPQAGPPTAAGEMSVADLPPNWYNPEVQGKYNQGQQLIGMQSMAGNKGNPSQMAQALQDIVNMGRQEKMISGETPPNKVAAAMAAIAGKPVRSMTGSGIDYDPYGQVGKGVDPSIYERSQAGKNQATIESAKIRAKGTVDAAMQRANITGNKLPSQAALIEYFKSQGETYENAKKLALQKKNTSLNELLLEAYVDTYNNAAAGFGEKDVPPEVQAQQAVQRIMDFHNKLSEGSMVKLDASQGNIKFPEPGPHSGRVIRDTDTGKRYRSDGTQWVEVQ